MFNPHYRISHYSLSLITKATELTTKINQANITFPLMARLQKEALSRNAHSSTSIEGNVLSLAQVSALSENRQVSADSLQKKEAANYIKALRWIVKNYQLRLTERRLLNLHDVIVDGLVANDKAGRYKKKQNYVVDAKKTVIYTPPSPKDSPRLARELIQWVNQVGDIHPVIVSAIFHHQCVSIHPFSDGNGRLSRAVSQWILYQKKFDPHHILALDDFYAGQRKRYYQKIQQARELDYDLTYWIEYVAEGVLDTVKKAYSRVSRFAISSKKKIVITPKQEELLEIITMHGVLSSRDIGRTLKVNRARVNQLIVPLLKARIIKREGSARATRYYLS
ncbi:Fic family protein [Candidatus Omnitrophota bacterium]